MSFDKDSVKEYLDIENMYDLLDYLGAEPRDMGDYLVCRTICHDGDSHKLYYYDNTQLFKCYSGECGSFDIFELVMKVKGIDLNTAVYYIVNYFNLQHSIDEIEEENLTEDWKLFKKWEGLNDSVVKNDKIVLPEIERNIIDNYPQPRILTWEREFIPKEVSDYMGIRYNPIDGAILIPHYDENDRLVGIRQRTLVSDDEIYGKYRPIRLHGKMLSHPLGFNLYGLNKSKDRIKEMKTALVFESEKGVMQAINYMGIKNNICVAMCGSTLSNYQFNLLLDAGAEEICIGIDKDYEKIYNDDYKKILNKMEKMYNKYSPLCNISFMFDTVGLTGYKQSPTDCGKDTFIELWTNRIVPNQ